MSKLLIDNIKVWTGRTRNIHTTKYLESNQSSSTSVIPDISFNAKKGIRYRIEATIIANVQEGTSFTFPGFISVISSGVGLPGELISVATTRRESDIVATRTMFQASRIFTPTSDTVLNFQLTVRDATLLGSTSPTNLRTRVTLIELADDLTGS